MKYKYYLPIYKYNDESNVGGEFGTTIYSEIKDLSGFEPDAIDVIEVEVNFPDYVNILKES